MGATVSPVDRFELHGDHRLEAQASSREGIESVSKVLATALLDFALVVFPPSFHRVFSRWQKC